MLREHEPQIDTQRVKPNVAAVALMFLFHETPKILMSKRVEIAGKKYDYTMPGGKVEDGETIKDAGKRELWEEVGLRVRKKELKLVGKPYVVDPSVIIQFLFCHIETAAPWQQIVNCEPDKHEDWVFYDLEKLKELSGVGGYPDIQVTGHVATLLPLLTTETHLFNRHASDNSWLGYIHARDLIRFYGLKKEIQDNA